MSRRHVALSLYIAREYGLSFLVAFLFFFFIFFVNQLLLLAEDILSKHVAFTDVVLLVVYSLPAIIAISFPFASLVGCLMAIGRLSSDNEILALQASGVSHGRIFAPLLALGLAFSLFSFMMNDYFLPLGTINFGQLYMKILYSNPELELEPYSVKRFQDSDLVTGDVHGGRISDLVILDSTPDKGSRVIIAKRATLSENSRQRGVISLDLSGVFSQTTDAKNSDEFDYSTAKRMRYNILLSDINVSVRAPTAREMSSVDVYRMIRQKKRDLAKLERAKLESVRLAEVDLREAYRYASTIPPDDPASAGALKALESAASDLAAERTRPVADTSLRIDQIELNRKFSVPFACLLFVVFAFPVGLLTRRSGRSVGFGVGLFVSILYWGMLVAGQTLGYRMEYSPAVSMWLPNIVILALGLVFSALRLRR